ncbi:MAG: penicillin-binding protein 2 [Candidatus Falkowbacteria bacterium]|nr:penicillin-binding protein 2 [Candidatus Falkowbacteria bacterium]
MRDRQRPKKSGKDNRLRIIMAVIFLLVVALIVKLVDLQITKYDLYFALASDQHEAYNKLEPARGKILIQDDRALAGNDLYPAAINKEFAQVYAVPDSVQDPNATAEKLYTILDQAKVEKEVEELFSQGESGQATTSTSKNALNGKEQAEYKKMKKDLEIAARKKSIIDEYVKKLAKKNDPYEPISSKVEETLLEKLKAENLPGINYFLEKYRYYPDANVGAHILGFVGFDGNNKVGRYGLEGFFNEELTGKFGSIKAERSGTGQLIIINDQEYNQPINGSDLVLTINRSIQYFACKKLEETAMRHGADGGSVIMVEPKTGAIIAMCSWPDFDPNNYGGVKDVNVYNNPAIFSEYEPGSVFKVITMSAGLDLDKVTPETTYNDLGSVMIEGWPKPIKNSDFETFGGHGITNMEQVLEKSLNTGAIFVVQKVGADNFLRYVKDFGFGEKTGIELETESDGDISPLMRKKVRPVEVATASFGQGISVTPLQIVMAYSAVANGGILMHPYIVSEIDKPDGTKQITQPKQIRRVISERAAWLMTGMMVNVVEKGHAQRAKLSGYYVAGKTGTAQIAEKSGYSENRTTHTFIGFTPSDDPKFVMLVKLDDPKDAPFAESTAVPLFSEIAEFALNYYQVPKER